MSLISQLLLWNPFFPWGRRDSITNAGHTGIHSNPSRQLFWIKFLQSSRSAPCVTILHASLKDYLFDQSRSTELFLDPPKMQALFSTLYISHLDNGTALSYCFFSLIKSLIWKDSMQRSGISSRTLCTTVLLHNQVYNFLPLSVISRWIAAKLFLNLNAAIHSTTQVSWVITFRCSTLCKTHVV